MSKVRSNLNRSSPNTGAFSAGLAALQVHSLLDSLLRSLLDSLLRSLLDSLRFKFMTQKLVMPGKPKASRRQAEGKGKRCSHSTQKPCQAGQEVKP